MRGEIKKSRKCTVYVASIRSSRKGKGRKEKTRCKNEKKREKEKKKRNQKATRREKIEEEGELDGGKEKKRERRNEEEEEEEGEAEHEPCGSCTICCTVSLHAEDGTRYTVLGLRGDTICSLSIASVYIYIYI